MTTLSTQTVEELENTLNSALMIHLKEIGGLPLTPADVVARFIVYAASLRKVYGFGDAEMLAFIHLADKAHLDFQTLDTRMGNA